MPHFAEALIADDPERLETLRAVLNGPRRSGSPPQRPPTLEARFGVRTADARDPSGQSRRSGTADCAGCTPGSEQTAGAN